MLVIQRPTVEAIDDADGNRQKFAVGPLEPGALAVDERLGPHDDAWRAETALQRAGRGEHPGVARSFVRLDTFERDDGAACGFRQRKLT